MLVLYVKITNSKNSKNSKNRPLSVSKMAERKDVSRSALVVIFIINIKFYGETEMFC